MIALACANGHSTRVLERNATKRLKCKECGQPLSPARSTQPADAAAATPSKKCIRASPERLISQEAHVKAMAFWSIFGGVLLAIVGALEALRAMSIESASDSGLGGFVTLGLALGFFVSGIALWGFVGWARKLMIVLNVIACGFAALELIAATRMYDVPVGACVRIVSSFAFSAGATWVLLGSAKKVFDPMYAGAISRDGPKPRWFLSPFFWGPWIALFLTVGSNAARLR